MIVLAGDVGGTKTALAPLMDAMPVHVALNPRAPLLGAAQVASSLV